MLFLKWNLINHPKTAFDLSSKIQLILLSSLLLVLLCQFLVRLKAFESLLISRLKCLKIPLDTPVNWLKKYPKNSLPLLTIPLIMLCQLNDLVRVDIKKLRVFNMVAMPLYSTSVLLKVNSLFPGYWVQKLVPLK